MAVIITMSIVLGAELGPRVDPTTTTYTPRPEWYFFFLFELLKVIKPPPLVPFATIGIPTVCMILLFLLPFYDRNPERRPERRPVATTAGILTIIAMGYLTYLGASAGPPAELDIPIPANVTQQGPEAVATFKAGQQVVAQSGCGACHKFGENGNDGPGPELTEIGGAPARPGDRAHAHQPAVADALVQGPAAGQPAAVQRDGAVPLRAQVARTGCAAV